MYNFFIKYRIPHNYSPPSLAKNEGSVIIMYNLKIENFSKNRWVAVIMGSIITWNTVNNFYIFLKSFIKIK